MPPLSSIGAFAALSFVLIAVPGPSVLFVVSRAVAHGRRVALETVVGNAAGVYVQVVLVAVGLGAVVERSVAVFTAVKFAGAAYLVWLGAQAVRHRHRTALSTSSQPDDAPGRSPVIDGFVVGIANPKAIVFFAAILPQFVDRGGAPAGLQMMLLGVVFVAIALVSDGVWGLVAGSAREWFVRSPRRLSRLGTVGGLAMVGLGIQLAITGRGD